MDENSVVVAMRNKIGRPERDEIYPRLPYAKVSKNRNPTLISWIIERVQSVSKARAGLVQWFLYKDGTATSETGKLRVTLERPGV